MQRSLVRSTRDAVTNQAATAYVTTSTSTAAINCALTCVVTTSTPTAAINCAAEPVCVLQKLVDLTVRNKRLAADNRTLQQGGTVTAAPARTLGKSKWGKVRASVVTESAGDSSCSTGLCCCFLHYCGVYKYQRGVLLRSPFATSGLLDFHICCEEGTPKKYTNRKRFYLELLHICST